MSIALIDQDCLSDKKDFFYDLDIMKLASYYKSKKEITKLLLIPSEYTQYTYTYFIKNRFDYKLPKGLFTDPKITYRGYAFSADNYEPLPEDIEKAFPDISIYDTYLKFNDDIAKRRTVKLISPIMENACHSRLSTNGIDCNVPTNQVLYKDTEGLCLYDYNIFGLSDWREATKDMKQKSLRLRFSPISYDFSDIKYLLENYNLRSENHVIMGGNLDRWQLKDIISLGELNKDKIRVELLEDLNPYNEDLFNQQIIYALNTILALKNAHTRIHAYINPHYIDERTAYLNNIAYWCNRNHSDISFKYFMYNLRKQSLIRYDKLAKNNEIINYLYNVIPSKWRSVI